MNMIDVENDHLPNINQYVLMSIEEQPIYKSHQLNIKSSDQTENKQSLKQLIDKSEGMKNKKIASSPHYDMEVENSSVDNSGGYKHPEQIHQCTCEHKNNEQECHKMCRDCTYTQ